MKEYTVKSAAAVEYIYCIFAKGRDPRLTIFLDMALNHLMASLRPWNLEYLFSAIAHQSTLTRSGSSLQGPISEPNKIKCVQKNDWC